MSVFRQVAVAYIHGSILIKYALQDISQARGLSTSLQCPGTYQPVLTLVAAAQQFCTEVGEAFIMIFVGMIAPDGISINSSQALLRYVHCMYTRAYNDMSPHISHCQ